MPADVSFDPLGPMRAAAANYQKPATDRLPLGACLAAAICVSSCAWVAIAAGVRVLFF